jgi:hypothetical protein
LLMRLFKRSLSAARGIEVTHPLAPGTGPVAFYDGYGFAAFG